MAIRLISPLALAAMDTLPRTRNPLYEGLLTVMMGTPLLVEVEPEVEEVDVDVEPDVVVEPEVVLEAVIVPVVLVVLLVVVEPYSKAPTS